MVTRNTTFVSGEHYHVYNRGNSKQKIFAAPSDYERFLRLIYFSNSTLKFNLRDMSMLDNKIPETNRGEELVKIGAFCLMRNHFHMLVKPLSDDAMSRFMLKLGTGYVMYFNTKYERTGSLFEGRYRAKFVASDNYLKYLFSYIHLNPIANKDNGKINLSYSQGVFDQAVAYPYSSLKYYLPPTPRAALGVGGRIIDRSIYGLYFRDKADIRREIFDWINYDSDSDTLGQL